MRRVRSCARDLVRMAQVVLPQEVLAVVVAVRRAHDRVDMLDVGLHRVGCPVSQIRGTVVIELDQDAAGNRSGTR